VAGVLDAGKDDTKALLCSPAAAAVLHGSSFLLTFFARNLILQRMLDMQHALNSLLLAGHALFAGLARSLFLDMFVVHVR